MSIGIPVKILHEADGHTITLELKNGELYRGTLVESEDNMNCKMKDITVTGRDGKTSHMEFCYLRGSKIRFFILPDMLKNAPMFKRIDGRPVLKGKALGFSKSLASGKARPRGRGGFSGRGGGGDRGGGRGGFSSRGGSGPNSFQGRRGGGGGQFVR
ncbi:LSM domain-containing protein [Tieghemostelium lacteum]|uniref:Small nuclear ribonucleoprotein Sm D3 n=1 Tax=Tieghemostelium lacteum TaxID=361077 RepID=A0A151Z546_TIELA|nr:LSM domain-containing protein [Tieghemostelium lacteum]|eukprot:KYQ89099.1 LSM domain-containing protein [Tieghemostelium lacteum]